MGFFKSLFDEAGKKTGSAIGNKLFPKSTDYIRLGELGKNKASIEEERETQQELLEAEHQSSLQQQLLHVHFDSQDIDYNVSLLTQIAAVLDSLPKWSIHRTEMEQKTHKMAKSLMQSGIAICKRIDPNNPIVALFDGKY